MAVKLSESNFQSEVLESEVPVLVDFWAQWCAPCHMITPILEQLDKEYDGKIKIGKLNVDEAPGLAGRYNIRAIPTVMIFKNGSMVEQMIGVLPKETMAEKVRPHLD